MKICIAVSSLESYRGVSFQARLLAFGLQQQGYAVLVVSLEQGFASQAPCVGDASSSLSRYPLAYEKVAVDLLPSFFREKSDQYDLVHFFGMDLPLACLTLLKKLGKKVILRPYGFQLDDPQTLAKGEQGRAMLSCLQQADSFVGISEPLYRSLLASPLHTGAKNRIVKIVNAVDTDYFTPVKNQQEKQELRKKLGIAPSVKLVLFIGRFQYFKGADRIMDCWPLIRKACPESLLITIGSLCTVCQTKTDACEKRSSFDKQHWHKEMNLVTSKLAGLIEQREGMRFLDNQPEVRDYLKAADLFLFPSRQEGMPNALLEAMACGIPPVTAGLREITDDIITDPRLGWVVPDGEPAGFAQAVISLLSADAQRENMSREVRQHMETFFSLQENCKQHLALYQHLLTGNADQ